MLILLLRAVDQHAVVRRTAPQIHASTLRRHDLAEVVASFLREAASDAPARGVKNVVVAAPGRLLGDEQRLVLELERELARAERRLLPFQETLEQRNFPYRGGSSGVGTVNTSSKAIGCKRPRVDVFDMARRGLTGDNASSSAVSSDAASDASETASSSIKTPRVAGARE